MLRWLGMSASTPPADNSAASADRGEDEVPVASTSTLPPPSRKLACLGNLPPELKLHIVRKVAEVDMEGIDEDDPAPTAWIDDVEGTGEDSMNAGIKRKRRPSTNEEDGWRDVEELELGPDGNPTPEALARVRDQYTADMEDVMRPSGIEALTLVNHEFNELAVPIMWQNLDFEDRSNEAILACIRDILPKHGRHVRSLEFGQADTRMMELDPPSSGYDAEDPFLPMRRDRLAVVEAAEKLAGVTPEDYNSETRHRRTRSLLVAEVVRLCPNVVRVDCEGMPRTRLDWADSLEEQDLDDRNVVYATDHALEAVKTHLGAQLTDLTFLVNDDSVTTEAHVADLLLACPNLLRLELESYVPSGSPENREKLHGALAALSQLESFTHAGGGFIDDAFAEREDVAWPLKVLALGECEDLSFPAFFAFVHRFASTLECLDLDGTPHTNVDKDNEAFAARAVALPRLDTLVLATQHEASFLLSAFAQCPIRELSLGFCPAVELKDVEAFLDLHVETLRRIEVAGDAALTEAQVESLEVLCHAKGIECELLAPDEDDSEEEGESEWDDEDVDQDWGDTDEEPAAEDAYGWSDEEQ
ncbi:hypothetical protein JCM10449v2_004226 [Rhodotorula kratochvilovae]